MTLVLIADFFVDQVLGGGELNNEELVRILEEKGQNIRKINSHLVTPSFIEGHNNFIVSNFSNLSNPSKNKLLSKRYVIYEHDHQYINGRNPGIYKDYLAPKNDLVNLDFYSSAIAVLCQSSFHMSIIQRNTKLDNIVNLSGNLWDMKSLEFMRELSNKPKNNKYSIMNSAIAHKNTSDAIKYCTFKKYQYELISDPDYYKFLEKLSSNSKFIFLPKTPETLSRVVVEARMMNTKVTTNNRIGATKESWYSLKGSNLIDIMIEKRKEIPETVLDLFNENPTNNEQDL